MLRFPSSPTPTISQSNATVWVSAVLRPVGAGFLRGAPLAPAPAPFPSPKRPKTFALSSSSWSAAAAAAA
eukprot:CAMPEP_0181356606 /NCGR_PEP_ID=MMETSP1106-20121128/4512_1 /TAXON_ID=81844 /ORGANISM="Mantoniella antarctica, Strain SL-175" /LENGTH=69 /DNA_ID=CAMNT_0023469403 /DNA_START=542 /DNA_END=748 /DNA_ORIENTATION=-